MKDTISSLFGQKLKKLREDNNYTQEDVGAWFNMGKSTVSQWENGRIPHATILTTLAAKLGVTIDYLLGCDVAPISNSNISAEDLELLQKIKNLPADRREIVDTVIKVSDTSVIKKAASEK
ncbi:Transcriptional regulator, contains XRE-family HTH domain [Propionispira arboris]|uniref:Transcriptional regulator, contains XRE-family HTH domain n=1 Tax=Propionispira arboris TaxID=84035 RepID=A0A1H7A2C9_9FIRM|nr:helix-turn-helix transcriptional regulator [Propionispira arboris]SEJ59839.1 Transcriptional regulator, contains XRE-family HTH domain [Propionispira arboris]